MKFLLLVLAFAALLWLFPHIRIFFKRLSLCRRLTAACKSTGGCCRLHTDSGTSGAKTTRGVMYIS